MSELQKRVAVAVVAIPVIVGLVYLGRWYLAVPLAVFAALGTLELYRFGAGGVEALAPVGALGSAGLVLLAAWRPTFGAFAPWGLGLVVGVAAVALVLAIVARRPDEHPLGATAVTVFGTLYVGMALAVVPLLHALPGRRAWAAGAGDGWSSVLVLALPLAATWIGDAAAYFAGSAWGRSKLAPAISPNKSWVGFWADLVGAGAAAVLWRLVAGRWLPGLDLGLAVVAAVGVLLGVGAVVGDLAESLLKREAGVKDSGTFFPGHGGILDRLDALILTLPLAYVALVALDSGP